MPAEAQTQPFLNTHQIGKQARFEVSWIKSFTINTRKKLKIGLIYKKYKLFGNGVENWTIF